MSSKITVKEGNSPYVIVWIAKLNPDRTVSPYDFTGYKVEFFQKLDASDADGSPKYSSDDGQIVIELAPPWDAQGEEIVGGLERNRLTIAMTAANLMTPGIQFFKIDAIKSGRRETVLSGPLVIENV